MANDVGGNVIRDGGLRRPSSAHRCAHSGVQMSQSARPLTPNTERTTAQGAREGIAPGPPADAITGPCCDCTLAHPRRSSVDFTEHLNFQYARPYLDSVPE
ncbi:hypothetical protein EVAR_85274_1 [Eumeta japonica]|uniref:Uncharacterized protein n=1 Tax=Eumeta variegata TaxID=151549 RepID=A0A4C1V9C7_EUMVA|nr:hypothetical protein EVAR_85274_1 [Eumeta japonica]